LVVDVGRSGPSQEDERGARAGGSVGCSSSTVTAGACAPSIVIAGACAPSAVIAGACTLALGEGGPVGGQSPRCSTQFAAPPGQARQSGHDGGAVCPGIGRFRDLLHGGAPCLHLGLWMR